MHCNKWWMRKHIRVVFPLPVSPTTITTSFSFMSRTASSREPYIGSFFRSCAWRRSGRRGKSGVFLDFGPVEFTPSIRGRFMASYTPIGRRLRLFFVFYPDCSQTTHCNLTACPYLRGSGAQSKKHLKICNAERTFRGLGYCAYRHPS